VLDAGLPAPARGAFTTRQGGSSEPPWDALNLATHVGDAPDTVARNRAGVAELLQLDGLAFGEQVHGTGVQVVTEPGTSFATDALVTTTSGIGLVVMGADCLPVLLAGQTSAGPVVGAAHVGRGGLVKGVLEETVRLMRELAAEELAAVVGPGICGRCYEVPDQLADDAERAVPGSRSTTRSGTASIDLLRGARAQLQSLGVAVSSVGGCTLEQPEQFFSYRRDGVTGRHAGIVWIPRT
jgi:YfiH family protein